MKTSDRLRKFRQPCGHNAGRTANEIDAPLLHVLSDVCRVLRLQSRARRKVLGKRGMQLLTNDRDWVGTLIDEHK